MAGKPTVWLSAEKGNLIVYAPATSAYDEQVEETVAQIRDILDTSSTSGTSSGRTYWKIQLPESATKNMDTKRRLFGRIVELFPSSFSLSYRIGTTRLASHREWLAEL